jgi:Phage integrase, N-terminal SAM-like domain
VDVVHHAYGRLGRDRHGRRVVDVCQDEADVASMTQRTSVDEIRSLLPSWRISLMASNKAAKTIDTYTSAVEMFATFVAERGMPRSVASIRREHVEAFFAWMGDSSPARDGAQGASYRWHRRLRPRPVSRIPGALHHALNGRSIESC